MVELSSLPPELVLRVAYFLAPDHPGHDLLDEGLLDRNPHARRVLSPIQAGRNDIHNLSKTCRSFYGLLCSQRLRSVGFDDFKGISATKRMLLFLRYLRNNPEAKGHVVQLYVHSPVPYDDPWFVGYYGAPHHFLRTAAGAHRAVGNYSYSGFPSDVSLYSQERTSIQRITQDVSESNMLKDAAHSVGLDDVWGLLDKSYVEESLHEEEHSLNEPPANGSREVHILLLNSILVSLLLLHLPDIQHLLLALNVGVHRLMVRALFIAKTAGNHLEDTPNLRLKSLAVSGLKNLNDDGPLLSLSDHVDILSCFKICDAFYVGGFALAYNPSLSAIRNLTSLAFDRVPAALMTLHSAIESCGHLKDFIYIQPRFSDVPVSISDQTQISPRDIIDALEVHWTTIETLCLDFSHHTHEKNQTDGDHIDTLKHFTSLKNLWIDCDCFGLQPPDDDGDISFAERLPTSVTRLHLANSVGTVQEELLLWHRKLSDGAADVLVPEELELQEMFTQRDAQRIVKDLVAMFQKTEIPTVRLRSVRPTAW